GPGAGRLESPPGGRSPGTGPGGPGAARGLRGASVAGRRRHSPGGEPPLRPEGGAAEGRPAGPGVPAPGRVGAGADRRVLPGACRKELGQPEEAGKDLEQARQAPATFALDHYLLALAAVAARDKAEAVQQCEAALRAEPTHYWSLLLLGIALVHLGETAQDFA